MQVPAPVERLLAGLRSTSPRARVIKGAGGFVAFVTVTWWAWTSVGGITVDWRFVGVLLVVGAPLAIGALTAEQHVSTHLARVTVSLMSSFRTAVAAFAANYLPIPGAVLVRIGALTRAGSRTGRATAVAAVLGVFWLAMSAILAAPGLAFGGLQVVSVLFAVAGLIAMITGFLVFHRRFRGTAGSLLVAVGVVTGKVLIHGFNVYLGLRAVGAEAEPQIVLLISASAVMASALGLFPGGLGLREFLSGVLAAIGGFDPALAALGAVVTRAVITVGLGVAFVIATSATHSISRPGSQPGTGP